MSGIPIVMIHQRFDHPAGVYNPIAQLDRLQKTPESASYRINGPIG
jgi:hypothetical protein